MHVRMLAATSIAIALAVGSVAASGQSPAPAGKSVTAVESSASQPFATLAGVKAAPMASAELDKVKGLHIHFTTPSANVNPGAPGGAEGWHFVNSNNDSNFGNGHVPAGSGPGYNGLCGAALNSPALTIPGQGFPGNGGC